MKKMILGAAMLMAATVFGQESKSMSDATKKGSIVIEANTGSWATGNTSFSLISVDDATDWSIGADGGYFIADNFAIKAGLGYADGDSFVDGTFVYKLGAQYYFNGNIPVGVDLTGVTAGDGNLWVGLEGGYAWFVANNVALTPKLRYNITLDEEKGPSAFQGLIGFSIFF